MSFKSLQQQQKITSLNNINRLALQCTWDVFSVRKKMDFCINVCDAHLKMFSIQFTRKDCLTKHIRYYILTLSDTLYQGSILK
jgi:hypothetical protein